MRGGARPLSEGLGLGVLTILLDLFHSVPIVLPTASLIVLNVGLVAVAA